MIRGRSTNCIVALGRDAMVLIGRKKEGLNLLDCNHDAHDMMPRRSAIFQF